MEEVTMEEVIMEQMAVTAEEMVEETVVEMVVETVGEAVVEDCTPHQHIAHSLQHQHRLRSQTPHSALALVS